MADSPLVELKKALNTVVPQIIDRGHTALVLDESTNNDAFLNSYSKTIESAQVFLTSSPDLRRLAGDKASMLSEVKITGELDAPTLAALQMLAQASAADTSGQVSSGVKQTLALLNQVATEAQALPEAQRNTINTESRRRTATRNPVAASNSAGMDARDLMAVSDRYLGVSGNPSDNTDVLENTGRALKDYLKQQQAQNPDIGIDFTPQTVDARTAAFMHELLRQKMAAAGVQPDNLRDTLFQIWLMQSNGQQPSNPAMKELGEVGAMTALVDYITTGKLPSGQTTATPRTDSPWENPVQDRFFNRAVYVDLLNGDSVSNKSLLRPDGADSGQQALIREVMGQLGISTDKQTYTRDEVAKIATEIMVHQAHQLCIDEKDISSAMLEGRFNPNLDDVMLAHEGMGKPPRDQARVEQLERIGINPEEQHDVFFNTQFSRYRDQQWAERFGGIDDDSLFRLAQRLRPDIVPQDINLTYDQVKGHRETEALMADLRSRKVSPAGLFMWGSGGHNDPFNLRDAYNRLRDQKYVPALREAANEHGLNLCATDGSGRVNGGTPTGPESRPDDGTCFADDMDGPCSTNSEPRPSGGDDGKCYADDTEGPCSTGGTTGDRTPRTADDGKCYADDFGSACGNPEAGASETIRTNAGDSTGQDVNNDGRCYADDMAGPNCNRDLQTAPVR